MKELSLFTGGGGGTLGTKLLGWETIGYVEINKYCQKLIAQRIKDGILDKAPIFGDIKSFISEGYAGSYKGLVDVITAGFPCQPFSVAGKKQGEDDPRNMWPETIECIRIVRPRYVFLENVPGLLANQYIRRIFGDLAESGYDCKWRCLSAAEVGAPHRRKRLWIVANSNDTKRESVGNPPGVGWLREQTQDFMADPSSKRLQGATCGKFGSLREKKGSSQRRESGRGNAAKRSYWSTEPDVGRVANGVASTMDITKTTTKGEL